MVKVLENRRESEEILPLRRYHKAGQGARDNGSKKLSGKVYPNRSGPLSVTDGLIHGGKSELCTFTISE